MDFTIVNPEPSLPFFGVRGTAMAFRNVFFLSPPPRQILKAIGMSFGQCQLWNWCQRKVNERIWGNQGPPPVRENAGLKTLG